ncbi:helix-turn-helix domain-containing protein [Krasilnikovia sp. MM14-A1004]|uniref:helix-turn-helix domain-containing protein n=1 Tax=Krasilnikovia sp. MM14-A1004 TaxID=3373541 RepID=UPI00399CD6D0
MLRERRGWSQPELARASGMIQSAVARFEVGGTVPVLETPGPESTCARLRARVAGRC